MKQHAADLSMRRDLLQALVQHIADPRLELAQELSSPYAITTLERAGEALARSTLLFRGGQ